jgi:hypothetical protein
MQYIQFQNIKKILIYKGKNETKLFGKPWSFSLISIKRVIKNSGIYFLQK